MLVEINTDHFKWACGKAMVRLADATQTMPKHGDADRADYDKRKKQVEIITDALMLAGCTKMKSMWLDLSTFRLVNQDWPELRADGRIKEENDGLNPPVATVSGRSHASGCPPMKESTEST